MSAPGSIVYESLLRKGYSAGRNADCGKKATVYIERNALFAECYEGEGHVAYMGTGSPELKSRPPHWFERLLSTAGVDAVAAGPGQKNRGECGDVKQD
jgi:hypothetical protein